MKIKKVLVVEDENTLRSLLVEIFQGDDFTCLEAPNGLAATELLKKEQIDLLITDFRMPFMNGVDLVEWCRQRSLHFPVIYITANVDLLPREQLALSDCCASLLNKPVGIEDLMRAIESAEGREHALHCN